MTTLVGNMFVSCPAHARRRGLVSQVKILGLYIAPEVHVEQPQGRAAFIAWNNVEDENKYFSCTAQVIL